MRGCLVLLIAFATVLTFIMASPVLAVLFALAAGVAKL